MPGTAADSAGVPWAGRRFASSAHDSDDGRAPADLVDVLQRFSEGEAAEDAVVGVLREARLLVPLIAKLGDEGHTAAGIRVDKSQELSIVTVAGPDGRPVLPVFSSVEAMRRWNPTARPVPADGVRVALAAASDGDGLVVLDPAGPVPFLVRRPAVWALAQSVPWLPSPSDPEVREAFLRSVTTELAVVDVDLRPGDPRGRGEGPELEVRLRMLAGLSKPELDAALGRLAQRWAADDVIAVRVDSLRVVLVADGA